MKLSLEVEVSTPELLRQLLQHMRDFEAPRSRDVHILIGADCPDMTVEQARDIFASITPPFPFLDVQKGGAA